MKTRLYISKENLKYNVEHIKKNIKAGKKIIAMVKANAYGAGDVLVANYLQEIGITDFGVANIDEALRLRNNKITGMILVTSVCTQDEINLALENDISLSGSTIDNLYEINEKAKKINTVAKVHLKIDTGMTRLGFTNYEIKNSINEVLKLENINIEGIYTHLSCADIDEEYTKEQIKEFKTTLKMLESNIKFKYIHLFNSDGTQNYENKVEDLDYTHVRVGLMLYGYTKDTKPVLKLTAPVLHINDINKYTKVGYGGTFIAKPNMKIAVIKIGYADGLSRSLSNKITVNVNGIECPLVGNICMDMCMIDVTNVPNVNVNDEVIIWDYTNDLKEISKLSNKIVYETISNLGIRIERILE